MNRIAVGPRQVCKVFTLQSLPASDLEEWGGILDGFLLHAGVAAKAHECNKLGRQQFINLGRYIARSPVAEQRLSLTRNGMDVFLDDYEGDKAVSSLIETSRFRGKGCLSVLYSPKHPKNPYIRQCHE
jgi:hypothetical protein